MIPRQQTPQEFQEAFKNGQETTWWLQENIQQRRDEDFDKWNEERELEELNLDEQDDSE